MKHSVFVNYNLWNQTSRNLSNIPETVYNFTSEEFILSNDGTNESESLCMCVSVCILPFASVSPISNKQK